MRTMTGSAAIDAVPVWAALLRRTRALRELSPREIVVDNDDVTAGIDAMCVEPVGAC
jgi:hypothetical protein